MKNFNNALQVIDYYYAVIGPERHVIADLVIEIYKNSSNPYDILGVAYAYMWQGAKYREESIQYFEILIENYNLSYIRSESINEWSVYSNLADLYEKEYQFEKAIACLYKCIKADNGNNPADYIRIGNILVKVDISQAECFYLKLLNDTSLKKYKRNFAYALNEVLDKKNRGYVFKPRSHHQMK